MVISGLTYYLVTASQQKEEAYLKEKGKIIADQTATALLPSMLSLGQQNGKLKIDSIFKIKLDDLLKESAANTVDVIYIKVFSYGDLIWNGGTLAEEIKKDKIPLYDDALLKKGEKAPLPIEIIGFIDLENLNLFDKLLVKILNLKTAYYDIAAPITSAGATRKIGEIHIGLSQERSNRETVKTIRGIALSTGILLLGVIFLSVLYATFFTRPILRLKNAMVAVGHGDLSQHLSIPAKDELGLLTWNFNQMTDELREKEKMKDSFGKAVSEEVVEVMMSGDLFLGGEEKSVSMLFSDIRGFTKMSSSLSPTEIMEMLNEYFTRMEYIVRKNLGIIDKYVGDEIMAIFGAIDPTQDHEENACRTAIEMMIELEKLNKERKIQGKGALRIGIGINSGSVNAGMLGSVNRMNYTVIGDTVNMASRLCDAGGAGGFAPIVISEYTYEKVRDLVKVRSGHSIAVKGKDLPVKIYELLGIIDRRTTVDIKVNEMKEQLS